MDLLDRVLLARAEEQSAAAPHTLDGPDGWAVRERQGSALNADPPRRPCVGCGRVQVRGWGYCARCKKRIAAGHPVDMEAFPTERDARALRRRMPSGTWSRHKGGPEPAKAPARERPS